MNVKLSVNSANSICKAYRMVCESRKFDFELDGIDCRSEDINGTQIFALPDELRPKFGVLLKAIVSFAKQLSAVELNAREIDSFLAAFFELRSYTAEARRVVRETLSDLDTTDGRAIVALARLLEDKMNEAMATIEVTVTADMLEAKRRKLDNSLR
jgi:hypothetical protein